MIFFYIRQYEMSCNKRNKIYNLQIKIEQFTCQTKKAKKILINWN